MTTSEILLRGAVEEDLTTIVRMLADDPLGAERERFRELLPRSYRRAFAAIDQDPNNELIVAERQGRIVGVLQLTLIPNLTYEGSWRAQIEGVRVAGVARGQGIGRLLVEGAVARARETSCRLVQLTTDKSRPEALRFYRALGFVDSHIGLKLRLGERDEESSSVEARSIELGRAEGV